LVESQRKFFRTGKTKDLAWRKEQLKKLAASVDKHRNLLSEAIHKDLRRPAQVNEQIEVNRVLKEIEYTLAHIDDWAKPEEKPDEPTGKPIVVKDPLGVVLLLCPWNYPVTLVFMPLISILAAGNTAIVKPSEVSEHTGHAVDKVLSEAFDKEYVAVVQGGPEVANKLLKERYDYIFYTGSTGIGKIIMAAAAKHLTPVTLELGGKCPVFVESDADLDSTAKRIAQGKWFNNGQTCIAPDYVLTKASVKPKLVESLQKAAQELWGTEPKNNPLYSRVINQRHFDRLKSVLDNSKANVIYKPGELDRNDCFIPPIILEATSDDAVMKDELFGPILPILTVEDIEEAIEFINNREKPLAAYLFTKDEEKIKKFLRDTTSGGVTINDVIKHVGAQSLPFGGVGSSGMGRYHGKYGFDTFTHEKAVLKSQL
ncbi:Protein ALH-4 a, partial [Aphelenchoides avenae]